LKRATHTLKINSSQKKDEKRSTGSVFQHFKEQNSTTTALNGSYLAVNTSDLTLQQITG